MDEKHKNRKQIIKDNTKTEQPHESHKLQSEFISGLPSWINKPWMYILPSHPAHLISWKESWKSLIIDYSSHFKLHIISIIELEDTYPFNNSNINKKLTKKQISIIIDEMVDKGLATWIDEYHILVRIYYKTTDQWKEILVSYLFNKGYAAEVITLFEIQNMNEDWSTLPRDELLDIFTDLVKEGRAKWADSTKDSIVFVI